ncbi:glycosyltransferase family 2 protein [Mucilaginibacter glaciei]|uniref:glycosyltransferase family 2 protein n=1 Tax=Mucilaginibacter glaciei TaxID=2772109 RepID=UPI00293BFFF2|nr:glycosyltransferase family 2 protein [Mucilaginibacter glaciei]
MSDLKISVITVCYNAKASIAACIQSVIGQAHANIEYIIIDGASTDGTLEAIKPFEQHIHTLRSEPDSGIYDAINKGIALATGDIIGILNADDVFASADILKNIAEAFEINSRVAVYGDLDYVNLNGQVVRRWRSGIYRQGMFNWGWMPPHPTFYCRRELYQQLGNYSLLYGTAADYELMLRYIHLQKVPVYYLQKVMIKMAIGGVSNSTYKNRLSALLFDLEAMNNNKIFIPLLAILFKPLRKIKQFL